MGGNGVASKRNRRDVDAEVDLHGLNAEQLRHVLQDGWPEWRNLSQIRIVHGQGTTLKPEIIRWCAEMGIPYLPDSHNAGALRIFPRERTLPEHALGTTLRDKGLRLTAEQEAELRDPQAVARAREAERRRRQAEEQQRRMDAAARAAQKRRDEALWLAEMGRLDSLEKKRTGSAPDDRKIRPPIILPPVELKFQEGYWKAELTRVADTDTETLQVQKRTGLDKLAPPMKEEDKDENKAGTPGEKPKKAAPKRDEAAEQALFEAEMERLGGFESFEIRRSKRE